MGDKLDESPMNHLDPRVMVGVEAPAGLHEVSAQATTALVRYRDAMVCVVADASASWGLGVEAATQSLRAFAEAASGVPGTPRQLGRLLEESALRAQEELAERDPDADALFAATMLVVEEWRVTCAWAGDVLAVSAMQSKNGTLRERSSESEPSISMVRC